VGQFLSEVQSLIGQAAVPIVDGVQAKTITYKQDPSLGFVVVFVPESDRGPPCNTEKHLQTILQACRGQFLRHGTLRYG
jgi:hypothetical protein